MATSEPLRLFHLPGDVLWLILRHDVDSNDLKSLRLVHSAFHPIVNILVFGKIAIEIPSYLREQISGDSSHKHGDSSENSSLYFTEEYILCNMGKLRGLKWCLSYPNTTGLMHLSPIAPTMASGLEVQRIPVPRPDPRGYPTDDPELDLVDFLNAESALFKMQMRSLHPNSNAIPITQKLAQPFLSNLQALDLTGFQPTKKSSALRALKQNNIHIRHLLTNGYDLDVVDYLSSYHNTLRSLKLLIPDDEVNLWKCSEREWFPPGRGQNQDQIDEFKRCIWKFAIAAHAGTLEHLTILGYFRITDEVSNVLPRCTGLKSVDLKGEDMTFRDLIAIVTNIPSMRMVDFEFPSEPDPPERSECGTATARWYEERKDMPSRVRCLGWWKSMIDRNGSWKMMRFRVAGAGNWRLSWSNSDSGWSQWSIVADGDMEAEGMSKDGEEEGKKVGWGKRLRRMKNKRLGFMSGGKR